MWQRIICVIEKNKARRKKSVGNGVAPLIRAVREVVIYKVVFE